MRRKTVTLDTQDVFLLLHGAALGGSFMLTMSVFLIHALCTITMLSATVPSFLVSPYYSELSIEILNLEAVNLRG